MATVTSGVGYGLYAVAKVLKPFVAFIERADASTALCDAPYFPPHTSST